MDLIGGGFDLGRKKTTKSPFIATFFDVVLKGRNETTL
jgi:hypothetical protein